MTTNRQTPASGPATTADVSEDDRRPGDSAKVAAVEASDLEAAPSSQLGPQGESFYNPALTGSGTIMPDGTYGSPLPDPNLAKRNDDPEVTTDVKEAAPPDAPPKSATSGTSTSSTSKSTK